MYTPLLSVARVHPPPHCENTQVLREAITEDEFTGEGKLVNKSSRVLSSRCESLQLGIGNDLEHTRQH